MPPPLDPGAAAAEALRRVRAEADLLELTFDHSLDAVTVFGDADLLELTFDHSLDAVTVFGDAALLERMVGNLVENAVHHNRRQGWIRVSTARADQAAEVMVLNSGPIIPQEEIASLFEPFRSFAADRTGSEKSAGLGLSIVRSVVQVHGGQVTAEPIPEGGLKFAVYLPIEGLADLPEAQK